MQRRQRWGRGVRKGRVHGVISFLSSPVVFIVKRVVYFSICICIFVFVFVFIVYEYTNASGRVSKL